MNTVRTNTQSVIVFAAVLAVGSLFALPAKSAFSAPADAAGQSDHAALATLTQEMASLRQTVSDQQKQILADHTAISRLASRVAASTLTSGTDTLAETANASYASGPFTIIGNDVYLTGYNLHIQSGSGATNGPVNGLGNVIIGYNEARANGSVKTGSHNLILGMDNNYGSYAGIIAGFTNASTAPFASVTGGEESIASGEYSSVTGGNAGFASGTASSVTGGFNNYATGPESVITGGWNGLSSNSCSSVTGGFDDTASGWVSSVQGGYLNTASGYYSSVSGGYDDTEAAEFGWEAGSLHTP